VSLRLLASGRFSYKSYGRGSHGVGRLRSVTSSPSGERHPSRLATTVIGVLGTVAGLTFALYLVGVLFEFRRLKTLGLPADQPVSAMPHDLLLVVGVRSLLVPVGVAIAATAAGFLASVALRTDRGAGAVQRSLSVAGLAGITAGAIVFIVLAQGSLRTEHVVLVAAGVLFAGAARYASGRWRWLPRPHLAAFACMLVVGLAVAYEHAMHPPVHFDHAIVFFVDGRTKSGFYIGRASDEIFLAPSVGNATCRLLDVIFTKDVTRISLQRGKAIGGAVARHGNCTKK
jgi:hypothetical protein